MKVLQTNPNFLLKKIDYPSDQIMEMIAISRILKETGFSLRTHKRKRDDEPNTNYSIIYPDLVALVVAQFPQLFDNVGFLKDQNRMNSV